MTTEESRGVEMDDAVLSAEETKVAAEQAYPFGARSSESQDRQTRFYRFAFRAGAAWYAATHPEATDA